MLVSVPGFAATALAGVFHEVEKDQSLHSALANFQAKLASLTSSMLVPPTSTSQ